MDRAVEGFKIKRNSVNFCPVFPRLSLPSFLPLSGFGGAGYLPFSSSPQKLNFSSKKKEKKILIYYIRGRVCETVVSWTRIETWRLFSLRESRHEPTINEKKDQRRIFLPACEFFLFFFFFFSSFASSLGSVDKLDGLSL